jgi:beta-lactamase regulating signal transducer with metallopeptidase domain
VPNVASFSGISILDFPFGFLIGLFTRVAVVRSIVVINFLKLWLIVYVFALSSIRVRLFEKGNQFSNHL